MQKYQENYENAKHHLEIAEHMAYVSMPILEDTRFIIKIFDEIYKSLVFMMRALLQYESSRNKIRLYNNSDLNLKTFKTNIAPHYLSLDDLKNIDLILKLKIAHNNSLSEFVRNDKFVFFLGDGYELITLESIKELIKTLENLILSTDNLKKP